MAIATVVIISLTQPGFLFLLSRPVYGNAHPKHYVSSRFELEFHLNLRARGIRSELVYLLLCNLYYYYY